jgi:hypothetical protein
MINSARGELAQDPVIWWSITAAFVFMVSLVLAANLFADAVREAFDPRGAVPRPSPRGAGERGMSAPLLSVSELSTHIDSENGLVRALDRVSFDVSAGETFALLGESGCGKSVTALSLMRLLPPGGFVAAGSVVLDGQDLCALSEAQMRQVRGAGMAMIFQEPMTSLNPVLRVGQQIGEVLRWHLGLQGAAAREAVALLTPVEHAGPAGARSTSIRTSSPAACASA